VVRVMMEETMAMVKVFMMMVLTLDEMIDVVVDI
jgi:hypothetical protein